MRTNKMLSSNEDLVLKEWLTSNANELGVLVALAAFLVSFATLAFSALRYVTTRRDAQLQVEFENYHRLIAQLVGSERSTESMKMDSQIAIVYELHRFKRYKPVTLRIIRGLRDEWVNKGTHSRLISEMDIAIRKLS